VLTRIVRGRTGTITKTFTFTPTGTPTAAVVRTSDGSTVTGAVGTTADPRVFTLTIPAAQNSLLDAYAVTWSAINAGSTETFADTVEVAGDVLFTIAQARAAGLSDTTTYPDDKITEARTYSETEIERALGFALVPRYSLDTLSGMGRPGLRVRHPYVRAIRSVSISGVPLATVDVAAITANAGVLYGYTWPIGYANVLVGYEHGLSSPPPGATRAALNEAVAYLNDGSFAGPNGTTISPNTIRVTTADGAQDFPGPTAGALLSWTADRWVSHNRIPPC
jgi:hypothetical protein